MYKFHGVNKSLMFYFGESDYILKYRRIHLVCFISNAVLESTLDEPQMSMLVAYFTRKIHTLLLNIIDFKKLS